MNRIIRTTTILTAALVAAVSVPTGASAAANPSNVGQALEISPPVLTLFADPGKTIKSQVSIRDVSTSKLIVQGQINDFVAKGEDGVPQVILDDTEPNPYSMKSWFRPLSELTLKPKEIQNLPITISVPANAAPGGYYAVVRFTATAPELRDTGVSLSASLGALVFLRVNGAAKESMNIVDFHTERTNGKSEKVYESAPINFITRIKNTGNLHEQPTGQVTVTDMFGKKVANVNVNLERRNVLPGSVRRFESPLDKSVIGTKVLFGRYKASLKMTYGDNKQVITKSVTFWVIPYKLILFAVIGLIIAFLVLRNLLGRYNRAVVKRATRSKRK